ncbi:hypothetical protein J2754_002238 [Halarchaeum solikamskense]|uniref:DUF7837 family putative zinc-binding protein n=1 Tax=Halarchaeum nitratireducens TaxID=489913 RepID=UPI001B3A9A10|nr:hypothetical protein [Halarchaeum solikamskense]MBP2251901.1 hypothetical protein [Halarchaeum solikamskense]
MSAQRSSPLGVCPHCHTDIAQAHVLIEYETSDGNDAVWTECPGCGDIVDPV